MDEQSIKSVLEPLCGAFAKEADAILDIRECLLLMERPGRCVDCYFRLLERAQGEDGRELSGLRQCLESHMEVVAQDEEKRLLERLPLRLEREDLQTYCEQMMEAFVKDRRYAAKRIELCFQFKVVETAA